MGRLLDGSMSRLLFTLAWSELFGVELRLPRWLRDWAWARLERP